MNSHGNTISSWLDIVESAALASNALCIAVFSIPDRSLLFGNKAFHQLAQTTPAESLINPTFERLEQLSAESDSRTKPLFEGLMTIGSDTGMNTTINAKVFRDGDQMLVTGEIDLERINKQNQRLSELNRETSNLQRQLTKDKILLEHTLYDLKKANEQLGIVNEEKNKFMNMAAHDLRNPIAIAISYADILINDPDSFSASQRETFLKTIEERLRFSLKLMSELLDISKIEAGDVELNMTNNDYVALVNKTVEFNQMVARYKNIHIRIETDISSWHFAFDKNKIEQVLNNLLSNAIKYSFNNSYIIIWITKDENGKAVTSVIDQGAGIKKEELPNIFQPFHKSSTTPTAGESSTGLGLAISKKIVEEHGGWLEVSSRINEGSRFTFFLPAGNDTKTDS